MTMMTVATFSEHGGTDRIALARWPIPQPGPGEVLVRLRAAALNGFDPMILAKSTSLRTPLPMVPCGDGAGEIAALGRGVAPHWQIGGRVSLLPYGDFGMMGETALGTAREFAVVPQANLVAIPDEVSFEEAAALPVAYGTAYRMMVTRGKVKAGERVLVLGAAGGVGVCCVALAKAAGAEVVACASGAWKADRLRALGADHVIDTATADFAEAVRALYGKPRVGAHDGGGVDVVVNYIGGTSWVPSLKLLRPEGRMLVCGASAGHDAPNDIRYIWSYELSIIGSDGWTADDQATLLDMCAKATLKPVIHAVRPLGEVREAMQEMIDRRVFGKSILRI